jgi:hypothetical protein
VRLEAYGEAHNNILAVKNVLLNGPARDAGLVPFQDFIIGTREIAFKSLEEFAKYVEVNRGQEIRLWLYNVESECVREVALTPNTDWGGQGLLGCDVSFGYLNRIPFREKDRARMQERQSMLGIFNKLTGEQQPSAKVNELIKHLEEEVTKNSTSIDQNSVPDKIDLALKSDEEVSQADINPSS